FAFAVYEAPDEVDTSAGPVQVRIAVSTTNGATGTKALGLVQPLPVMIHGVWSSDAIWEDLLTFLEQQHYPTCPRTVANGCRVNYGIYDKGAPTFDPAGSPSVDALRRVIEDALTWLHGRNVAATRIDVVAHSMGGLVTRARMRQ